MNTDSIDFFPETIPFPNVTNDQYLRQAAIYIFDILQSPEKNIPLLTYRNTVTNAYVQMTQILKHATLQPINTKPPIFTILHHCPMLSHFRGCILLPLQHFRGYILLLLQHLQGCNSMILHQFWGWPFQQLPTSNTIPLGYPILPKKLTSSSSTHTTKINPNDNHLIYKAVTPTSPVHASKDFLYKPSSAPLHKKHLLQTISTTLPLVPSKS